MADWILRRFPDHCRVVILTRYVMPGQSIRVTLGHSFATALSLYWLLIEYDKVDRSLNDAVMLKGAQCGKDLEAVCP